MDKLSRLEARREELSSQIKKYKDCDPETLKVLEDETKTSIASSNRWTDNIYSLHSWINNKFPNINVVDLNKQFGIPQDLDYVEN